MKSQRILSVRKSGNPEYSIFSNNNKINKQTLLQPVNDIHNGIERTDEKETERKVVEEPVRRTEVNTDRKMAEESVRRTEVKTDETINGPDKLLNMKRNR